MKKLLKSVAVTLMLVAAGILAAGGGWNPASAQQGTIRPQFIEEPTGDYNPCVKSTISATARIDGWNFGTRQWSWKENLFVHIPYVEGHAKYLGVADPWIINIPAPSTIAKVRWDAAVTDDMRCTLIMPGAGVVVHTPVKVSGEVSTFERQQEEDDGTGGDCTLLVGCDDGGGSGGGGTGGSGGGDGGDAQLYLICLYNVTTDVTTGQVLNKTLVGCTIGY